MGPVHPFYYETALLYLTVRKSVPVEKSYAMIGNDQWIAGILPYDPLPSASRYIVRITTIAQRTMYSLTVHSHAPLGLSPSFAIT